MKTPPPVKIHAATVWLDAKTLRKLDRIARRYGATRAVVITRAVDLYVAYEKAITKSE